MCNNDMNVVCDALPLQESHPPANTRSKVSHSSVSATHRARERHSIPVHKSISLDVVLINSSCGLVLMGINGFEQGDENVSNTMSLYHFGMVVGSCLLGIERSLIIRGVKNNTGQ